MALLFGVMFLPGYLAQAGSVDPALFSSWLFHLQNLATALPQVLLLVYVLQLRSDISPADVGWVRPRLMDLVYGVLVAAGAYVLVIPTQWAAGLLGGGTEFRFSAPGPELIPAVLVTTLLTGYREELFFRSYLITRLRHLGLQPTLAGPVAVLIFSIGHLYQGLSGLFVTFVLGAYFAVIYLKTGRLHPIALGHGLYNMISLLLAGVS